MKALLGFLVLGTAMCHRQVDPEDTLFLSSSNTETVTVIGSVTDQLCFYEMEGSIYDLNKLKDLKGNYEASDKTFNTYKIVFNFCQDILFPEKYNCPNATKVAVVNYDVEYNVTTCSSMTDK